MTLIAAIESSAKRKSDSGNSPKQVNACPGSRPGRLFALICCAVILLGTALHFVGVDKKDCWFDEAATVLLNASVASNWRSIEGAALSAEDGRRLLQELGNPVTPLENVRENFPDQGPLFPLVAWMVAKCFGNNIDVMRATSGILGALIAPLFFWLTIESTRDDQSKGDIRAALIAAALAAVSPVFTLYSAEARPYTMLVVLVLATTIFLLRAQRTNRTVDWSVYALSMACSALTHITVLALIPGHCIYLLYKRVKVQAIVIAILPTIVTLLLWIGYLGNKIEFALSLHAFVNKPVPPGQFYDSVLSNLALSFVDIKTLSSVYSAEWFFPTLRICALFVPVLIALSLLVVLGKRSAKHNVVVLCLLLPTIFLFAADLALGGRRAVVVRYNILLCVSSIYATAIVIGYLWSLTTAKSAKNSASSRLGLRTVCVSALGMLVCLGLASQLTLALATTAWTKTCMHDQIVLVHKYVHRRQKPIVLVGKPTFCVAILQRLNDHVFVELVATESQAASRFTIPPGTDLIVAAFTNKKIVEELRQTYPSKMLRTIE